MPKVKTTSACKIQSIVKEFPDELMQGITVCLDWTRSNAKRRLSLLVIYVTGHLRHSRR